MEEEQMKKILSGKLIREKVVAEWINFLQWKALQRAKQILISAGKLNPDEMPKK